jgi:hypothetical protein
MVFNIIKKYFFGKDKEQNNTKAIDYTKVIDYTEQKKLPIIKQLKK